MNQIRRVVVDANGAVVIETVRPPEPGPAEVRVRTVLAGVCGSDTHAQHGRHPHITLPYAPGHEVVGVVEQLGGGVSGLALGDRVTVEPTLPCWDCKPCRTGVENLCEDLDFFGCGHPQGGMAELFTVAVARVHRVPAELDDVTASLIEPLATPVHAARLAGVLEGRTVAILGAGTIGLLMLAVAREAGARRVVVTDPLPQKRSRARSLGADAVVDTTVENVSAQIRLELGESADVVFDCVAVESTVAQAIDAARKGGTVVVVGVPASDVRVPLPVIQDEQIRIQGSATYLPDDLQEAMRLLGAGAVAASDLVTAEFSLDEAAAAFDAAVDGAHVKVLVRLSEHDSSSHLEGAPT